MRTVNGARSSIMTTNLKGIAARRHREEQQVLAKRPSNCFSTYGNFCPFLRGDNCHSRGGSLLEPGHRQSWATDTLARQGPPPNIPLQDNYLQTTPPRFRRNDPNQSVNTADRTAPRPSAAQLEMTETEIAVLMGQTYPCPPHPQEDHVRGIARTAISESRPGPHVAKVMLAGCNLNDREAVTDCGGAARPSHDNAVDRLEQCDAFCFGLRPFDRLVCVRRRRYGASPPLTPCRSSHPRWLHRSSQPARGRPAGVVQVSRLSTHTSGGEQKS
jgi:hypothetical protein